MRAALKSLDLEPDPSTLPADPAEFSLLARMIVGPPDTPGEESLDVSVCTPEWLAKVCRREEEGMSNARHHLVVDLEQFDQRALRAWLSARVEEVEASTWAEIGVRLGRLGRWEFVDDRSSPLTDSVMSGRCRAGTDCSRPGASEVVLQPEEGSDGRRHEREG